MVAASTEPLASSTATTCAPKIPVTPGGDAGRDSGFVGKIRPVITPTLTASAGSGYKTRNPARSSSPSGASSCCAVGRAPLNVPGTGAYGYIMAFQTAEWLNPR